MAKNLILDLILACLAQICPPPPALKNIFMGFISATCQKLLQAIFVFNFKENLSSKLKKMAKKPILALIQAHWTQIWANNFLFKNLAFQSLDVMVSYHNGKYQKKTNDRIFTKLRDERTDGQTHSRTKVISQEDAVRLQSSV